MGMEDFVLLGSFAAAAILGYYIMARVDNFLGKVRQKNEEQERTTGLNIATTCFNVIPTGSNILKDINHLSNVHCNLSVGHEQEVIKPFDGGDADGAIISANSDIKSETLTQRKCIALTPQSFSRENRITKGKPVEKSPQHQKVLWESSDKQSFVLNFVHYLCGQKS